LFSSFEVVAAESPTVSLSTDKVLTTPAAKSWKASATALYYDMHGTQEASGNTYSFGQVTVSQQNLVLEKTLSPDWKMSFRTSYLNNSYELAAGSKTYLERTSGLGDSYAGFAHPLVSEGSFRLLSDAGLMLPTGSIDQDNEFVAHSHYKYFLQLGSGTLDPSVGLTALSIQPAFQLGSRLSAVARMGYNHNDYRLGNMYRADAWADGPQKYGLTPRLVGYYRLRGAIDGEDDTLSRASTEYYHHDQIDWSASAALKYDLALWEATSLTAEMGLPLTQGMNNVDHVVISTRYYANLSLMGQF
jgi:hypothetical protein